MDVPYSSSHSLEMIPAPSPVCFERAGRAVTIRPSCLDASLTMRRQEGLAALLPILGCGEEAATLAFDALAASVDDDLAGRAALASIASDEDQHDQIILALRAALPPPPDQREILRKARRFHINLGRGTTAFRLARIAALDSAVCKVLGRLLHRNAALADAPIVHRALSTIWHDEARHVAVSRRLALARADGAALRPLACQAREALADILLLAGSALESLEVDPALLARDVRRLPAGLLA
jgi:hypothetical protein